MKEKPTLDKQSASERDQTVREEVANAVTHGVGALLRVQQAFVVFIGKLRVDRQPDSAGRS